VDHFSKVISLDTSHGSSMGDLVHAPEGIAPVSQVPLPDPSIVRTDVCMASPDDNLSQQSQSDVSLDIDTYEDDLQIPMWMTTVSNNNVVYISDVLIRCFTQSVCHSHYDSKICS
jgi:hypothetical protein